VGGDGTIHQALGALAGSETTLGIIPLGTGNDLAAALGIPARLDHAIACAVEAPVRRIDLARAGGALYAGVAGLGFDSDAARRANEYAGPLRGRAVYLRGILGALARLRPFGIRIDSDGGSYHGQALVAVFANSPRYGAGVRIAPEARLDDGLLDVLVVKELSRARLLANLLSVYRGTHYGHPRVVTFRARRAAVTVDRGADVFADGEPLFPTTTGGFAVEIVPRALAVAAPETPPTR
jgi:diacylglycerol kinase (ATP)